MRNNKGRWMISGTVLSTKQVLCSQPPTPLQVLLSAPQSHYSLFYYSNMHAVGGAGGRTLTLFWPRKTSGRCCDCCFSSREKKSDSSLCVSPPRGGTQLKFWEQSVQVNGVLLERFRCVSTLSGLFRVPCLGRYLLSLYVTGY